MTLARWTGWGVMMFLALVTALIVSRYFTLDPAVFFPQQRETYQTHLVAVILHVAGAMLALLIGPFQFFPRIRARRPKVHRWMGRSYLVGVLVGGLMGLYMAPMAFGGLLAQTGFGLLALLWLSTAFMAYRRIRAGDSRTHQQWMIRNYALTFAAVSLRIQTPLSVIAGIPFAAAYPIIAWTCWVPNLLIAEWIVARMMQRRRRVAVA